LLYVALRLDAATGNPDHAVGLHSSPNWVNGTVFGVTARGIRCGGHGRRERRLEAVAAGWQASQRPARVVDERGCFMLISKEGGFENSGWGMNLLALFPRKLDMLNAVDLNAVHDC